MDAERRVVPVTSARGRLSQCRGSDADLREVLFVGLCVDLYAGLRARLRICPFVVLCVGGCVLQLPVSLGSSKVNWFGNSNSIQIVRDDSDSASGNWGSGGCDGDRGEGAAPVVWPAVSFTAVRVVPWTTRAARHTAPIGNLGMRTQAMRHVDDTVNLCNWLSAAECSASEHCHSCTAGKCFAGC